MYCSTLATATIHTDTASKWWNESFYLNFLFIIAIKLCTNSEQLSKLWSIFLFESCLCILADLTSETCNSNMLYHNIYNTQYSSQRKS